MTTLPRPAEGTGELRTPAAGYPRAPLSRPHILVVNGRKVRHPVFVLGAPQSGTEMLARAFKRTPGFHMTLGQRWVLPVVQAFARTPSLARGRPEAAATVLRDAFAQGWQIGPDCCLGCAPACREAAGTPGAGPCVAEQGISRYGDASPELLYCADSLVDAFPDARLVQIVRDGRDVVAGMLADPRRWPGSGRGSSTWTPRSPTRCWAWTAPRTGACGRSRRWRASAPCAGAARSG